MHSQQRERPASASERQHSREISEHRHQNEMQHRSADNSPTNFSTSGQQPQHQRPEQQPREREQRDSREQLNSGSGAGGGGDAKGWGYSGIDLINSGAAFWQNYSGKCAHIRARRFIMHFKVPSWSSSHVRSAPAYGRCTFIIFVQVLQRLRTQDQNVESACKIPKGKLNLTRA